MFFLKLLSYLQVSLSLFWIGEVTTASLYSPLPCQSVGLSLQSTRIILISFLFYFRFPAEELLSCRLCFLIFFGTVPFTNPRCTLLEVEQGFAELCSFLGTPSPVFEYLSLVSHFGGLVNRLQHQSISCKLDQQNQLHRMISVIHLHLQKLYLLGDYMHCS